MRRATRLGECKPFRALKPLMRVGLGHNVNAACGALLAVQYRMSASAREAFGKAAGRLEGRHSSKTPVKQDDSRDRSTAGRLSLDQNVT